MEKSELYFFPDYTNHSIRHVEDILLIIEDLITDDTLELLSPTDNGVLVRAVALHDIGMHINAEMFMNMIRREYDNISDNWFKDESHYASGCTSKITSIFRCPIVDENSSCKMGLTPPFLCVIITQEGGNDAIA